MTTNLIVKGDRALRRGDSDKLGFRGIASRIATSLIDHASDNGLVVGIEGAWGSGKSSLLCLIEEELEKLPQGQKPTLINFRPWLVGDRDALLANLLTSLISGVDQVSQESGGTSGITAKQAKVAVEALRNFTAGICKAGDAVEVLGDAAALPLFKWIGKFMKFLLKHLGKPAPTSLVELKDKLVKSLSELQHRFIITIDDLDRLDSREAIEVLRLTRSVADFPNVVYLLCYDSNVLAPSIQEVAKVKDGHAYLEKIVQLTVMVPKPEPFQLRQWFSEELHKIASTENEEDQIRLQEVIDQEGGRQLKSPRSVVRALDSIRFFWPPLRNAKGDLADLVWLQLIKNENPSLYRWIENYCGTASVLSIGTARVEKAERKKDLSSLREVVDEQYFNDDLYTHFFSKQLPGIDIDYVRDNGNSLNLYQKVDEDVRNIAIRDGRLSSPDHYRLYFALSSPSHALTQEIFDSTFKAITSSSAEAESLILQLHNESSAGSLSKADMLLERLISADKTSFTSSQCENFLVALSNVMDEAYQIKEFDTIWGTSLWDRARKATAFFLLQVDSQKRALLLKRMFENGKAVDWLTKIFRRETFSHGRYGSSQKPAPSWLLSEAELDTVTSIMLSRYREMSMEAIMKSISLPDILFAWKQGGDEDGPKNLIANFIKTDSGLISVIEGFRTYIDSSDRGKFYVLKRDNLTPFLDYAEVKDRIKKLETVQFFAERAKTLSKAFEDGASY
jgi:predicted KAP-like P-loop ATPase